MEATVRLRNETIGNILPLWEWRVVDNNGIGWVVFRSISREDCLRFLRDDADPFRDYRFERVRKVVRPELSTYAKRLCGVLVEKHGREKKLDLIKDIRAIYGLGLKDAKELIEDYLEDN